MSVSFFKKAEGNTQPASFFNNRANRMHSPTSDLSALLEEKEHTPSLHASDSTLETPEFSPYSP